jgi:hypothetical protein
MDIEYFLCCSQNSSPSNFLGGLYLEVDDFRFVSRQITNLVYNREITVGIFGCQKYDLNILFSMKPSYVSYGVHMYKIVYQHVKVNFLHYSIYHKFMYTPEDYQCLDGIIVYVDHTNWEIKKYPRMIVHKLSFAKIKKLMEETFKF